jgi:hypothetical protein
VSNWEKGEVYNFAITEKGTGVYCGGCADAVMYSLIPEDLG